MSDAPFYIAVAVPLAGILVNVILAMSLCRRIDRIDVRVRLMNDRIRRDTDC